MSECLGDWLEHSISDMNIMNYACSSIVRDLPSLLKVYSSRFADFLCGVCFCISSCFFVL